MLQSLDLNIDISLLVAIIATILERMYIYLYQRFLDLLLQEKCVFSDNCQWWWPYLKIPGQTSASRFTRLSHISMIKSCENISLKYRYSNQQWI